MTSNSRSARVLFIVLFSLTTLLLLVGLAHAQGRHARLSEDLVRRLRSGDTTATSVIVSGTSQRIDAIAARHGLRIRKRLQSGAVVDVPAGRLDELAADGTIDQLSSDQRVRSSMRVTNAAIGADLAWSGSVGGGVPAVTGEDISVAVIDSGVAQVPELRGRIVASVDFTNPNGDARDEYGHGTHVAGIIAARSSRNRGMVGVAPAARIVNLKVLDSEGAGYASSVIEAIDWAIANMRRYRIRVINLSLGAPVVQSYRDDPLCQAVERAYRAGLVVVAAAGNYGRTEDGRRVFGAIATPGNSPFAVTVGALNTNGTASRSDDVMATYSSHGPTHIDRLVKPDLVAPGNKIVSLLAPGAKLATKHPEFVIDTVGGKRLQLSGTSMAAAVVSGAVALMIDATPRLQPAAVRFALQYSAERAPGIGFVVGGAGRLNVAAALLMPHPESAPAIARETQTPAHMAYQRVALGTNLHLAAETVVWGADTVIWGSSDTGIWGSSDTVIWGSADTVIWGSTDTVIWGSADTVIWGADDTVIWGADDTVIWGSDDTVIWGAADTVIWGSDTVIRGANDTVIWGADDTVIWGADDTVIWGASNEYVIWGD